MKTLLLCLLFAAAPKEPGVLVTLKGSLSSDGKPVTAARFYLAPQESHTALELDKAGRFEVKAIASREYTVNIDADGYAPLRRTVELDDKGVGDLGAVKLDALKTARASVVVAPRGSLAGAKVQKVELRHGSCANVRAQDDSGCLLAFCVSQDGPALQVARYSGAQLRPVGKVSIADAVAQLPKGTFVTGDQQTVTLEEGAAFAAEPGDPYCGAVLRVDAVK